MRFKLIIIVFLSYCMPSQAQYVANQIDSLLINRIFNVDYTKSFQTISVEEGLPLHSDVRSIVQDSIGYIWLATANGLARYNGYSVVLYKLTENGEELPKQRTLDLVITPDQNILLATVSGLFRYNRMLDKIEKLDIPEL